MHAHSHEHEIDQHTYVCVSCSLTHRVCLFFLLVFVCVVRLADGFNGADLRNVVTEAGMFAIRVERNYIIEEGQREDEEATTHESGSGRCANVGENSHSLLLCFCSFFLNQIL